VVGWLIPRTAQLALERERKSGGARV